MAGIYLYWEGTQRHWYYELCARTVLKHNPTARILNRKDVEEVVGPLPSELDDVYVIHRVDWIRKAFIERVGGLWLDMDFICLRPLDALATLASDFDYVGYKEWHGSWMDNLFAAKVGSVILRSAREHALEQVRTQGKNLRWLATSTESMAHAFEQHPWCLYTQLPTHILSPVSVMEPEWFVVPTKGDELTSFQAFGFMTSFHTLRGWLEGQSEAEFLAGGSRLANLLRRGLG